MNYFILSLLLISGYMMVRAFSFGLIHATMYLYRKSECIERIVNEQKACDFINATYQFIVTIINFFICFGCLFKTHAKETYNIVALAIISILYVVFFIIKSKLMIRYNLPNFYNDMIDYRSKQKVVTKDNDNEVDLARRIISH